MHRVIHWKHSVNIRVTSIILLVMVASMVVGMARGQAFYLPPSSFGQAELSAPESTSFYENVFQDIPAYEAVVDFPASSALWKLARPIGRLDILLEHRDGRKLATYCTASLIRDDLILTAHHCIPGIDPNFTVLRAELRMDYLARHLQGETFPVNITPLEGTSDLDFSILRVEGSPGATYGTVSLETRAPTAREELFLIHHPQGNPKQVTRVRCHIHNSAEAINTTEIRHRCDSQGGSSGGLIFSLRDQTILGMHWGGYDPALADTERYNVAKRLSALAQQSPLLAELMPAQASSTTTTRQDFSNTTAPNTTSPANASVDAPTTNSNTATAAITIAGTRATTTTQPPNASNNASNNSSNNTAQGFLALNTSPEQAEIYLGTQLIGISPLVNYPLAAGEHVLRIAKSGYDTRDVPLTIAVNQVSRGTIPLSPTGQERLLRPYGVSSPRITPTPISSASTVANASANTTGNPRNTGDITGGITGGITGAINAVPSSTTSSSTSTTAHNSSTSDSGATQQVTAANSIGADSATGIDNATRPNEANPPVIMNTNTNTDANTNAPPNPNANTSRLLSPTATSTNGTMSNPSSANLSNARPASTALPTQTAPRNETRVNDANSTRQEELAPINPFRLLSPRIPNEDVAGEGVVDSIPTPSSIPAPTAAPSHLWQVIAQGSKSSMTADSPRTFIINNPSELFNLWGNAHAGTFPIPTQPNVDFERFRVMAIFAGEQRLANHLTVTNLILEPKPVLHVSLSHKANDTQVSTPWIFVQLPREIALQATVTLRPYTDIARANR